MLHQTLWNTHRNLAEASLAHPFVRGLAEGTLELDSFKRYVAQDAFFLRAFLRAYAIALAKCDQLAHAAELYAFMGGAFEELKLHAAYAKSLGIDLENVQPLSATSAYIDFLLRTAWQTDTAQTLAAMTPCMRLYAFLGQRLAAQLQPGHPYGKWIETYSSVEFEQLAGRVEALLDALAQDTPEVRTAYRYALQCELEFFSAALDQPV